MGWLNKLCAHYSLPFLMNFSAPRLRLWIHYECVLDFEVWKFCNGEKKWSKCFTVT